jgi:uncharacterized membrane protein
MIIAKQTAAATASHHFGRWALPQTVAIAGVLVAETIAVNIVDEEGVALPLYDDVGVAVVMTATSQPLKVDSPCVLQFVKPTTDNAVGVQLFI